MLPNVLAAVAGSLTMPGPTKVLTLPVQPTRCGSRPDRQYVRGPASARSASAWTGA